MAIGALIAGIIGLFTCVIVIIPVVALVLGVLGLREINRDPDRVQGRGMAVSGIVLGAIGLLIGVGWIVLFAFGDSSQNSSSFIDDLLAPAADEYAIGTCVQNPEDVEYVDIEQTSCFEPHGGEIYSRGDVDPALESYPGDAAMFDLADEMCVGPFEDFVGVTYEESRLGVWYYTPDRYTWGAGDREVVCIVFDPAGGDLPPGSVEGTGI